MHELSIIQSVIESLTKEVEHRGGGSISQVTLSIGKSSGVFVDSLEFAFEACKVGSVAQGATLIINEPPLKGYCPTCDEEFTPPEVSLVCPKCSGPANISGGQELLIEQFIFDQEEDET
ncbi:MAG: hydrogenase maturation nickel metallochaperone HypA [SAR324 cluster bacterium]|nr:hydrogenase maturation nickel metallochaperone HypA [SAR324 cluster bacterium]